MACEIKYKNKIYSYEEWIAKLNEGLIDDLIAEGKVNVNVKPVETGKRATVKKMQESDKTTEETKSALKEFEDYDIRHNKETMSEARRWINDRGDDEALAEISKLLKTLGMSNLMKQAIRIELFDRFNSKFKEATQKGNAAKAEVYFNKMMVASKAIAENATDAAQSLQYMSVLSQMLGSVSGAIRFATKEIEESRDGQLRNLKPLIVSAQDMIDEINTMSKDELLKSQKIRDIISEFSNKAGQGRRISGEKAVKIFGKTKEQAKKDADAAIHDLFNMVKGGKAFATLVPDPRAIKLLSQWAYNRVIESGISLIEFVQEVNAKFPGNFTVDDIEKAWDESAKEADKKIAEESEREAKQAIAKSIIEPKEKKAQTYEQQAKREKKKELKASIDSQVIKAVTEFNKGNKEAFQELADSLSKQLEIAPEEISKFTESIKKLAEKKRIEVKEKTVKKYLPKKRKKDTEKKRQFYDKILELSESGSMTDTDLQDAAAKIMDLPSMTPEIAAKIEEYVEAINKAPEGKFKNTAVIKMLDYIAKQERFNLSDYMVASYKAGIFSGLDTQALNNISNAFGGMAYVFESFATNPKETVAMIKSLLNETSVSQAWNEAAMLMKTGIDPRFVEEKNRRQLEQRSRSFWGLLKGTKATQFIDPSLEQQKKYVFRALGAGDVMATTTLSDMAQTAIFRRLAIKEKRRLTGLEKKQFSVNTYIEEQMGLTEENVANAQKQAEKEYQEGILGEQNPSTKNNIIKIRRDEIIRQSRNPEVVKRANEFAQSQVFVNPPTGFTGIIASHLNNVIRDIPLMNALIPVVNIGANITQRGLQYTPPFAILRGTVYYLRNKSKGVDFSTSVREDIDALKSGDPYMEQRIKRFAAGTVAMIAILALFHEDDDEEENLISKITGKEIKLHGGGPGRIGNMKPTYQKQETGWKPYSIQVDDKYYRYDLIPGYNVLFATMGEYYDAVRYGKMKKKDATQRFAWALSNSYQVVLKNSFFQSVAGTLEGLLDGDPMKFLRTLVVAPVSGFAFPKFQRNIANMFDNAVYTANNFTELTTRSIPILNGYTNEQMLNALGEPIEKNWWDRIELWSTKKTENEIWTQMDGQNYSLPMPNMNNLSESLRADVDSETYNKFYKYRGESIKKYFEQYKDRLNKIDDKDIYDKTFDAIVNQASDEAKYKLAKEKGMSEYLDENESPDYFYYPRYERIDGKVKLNYSKTEKMMMEIRSNRQKFK